MNKEIYDNLSRIIRLCKELQAFEKVAGFPIEDKEHKLTDIRFLTDGIESAWRE